MHQWHSEMASIDLLIWKIAISCLICRFSYKFPLESRHSFSWQQPEKKSVTRKQTLRSLPRAPILLLVWQRQRPWGLLSCDACQLCDAVHLHPTCARRQRSECTDTSLKSDELDAQCHITGMKNLSLAGYVVRSTPTARSTCTLWRTHWGVCHKNHRRTCPKGVYQFRYLLP